MLSLTFTHFLYCSFTVVLFPALQWRQLSANDEAALAGGSEANGALRRLLSGAGPSVRQHSQKKLKWEPLHPGEGRLLSVNSRFFSPLRADSFDGWHLVRPFLHAATNKSNTGAAADKLLRAQNTRAESLVSGGQPASLNSVFLSSVLTLSLTARENRVWAAFAQVWISASPDWPTSLAATPLFDVPS